MLKVRECGIVRRVLVIAKSSKLEHADENELHLR